MSDSEGKNLIRANYKPVICKTNWIGPIRLSSSLTHPYFNNAGLPLGSGANGGNLAQGGQHEVTAKLEDLHAAAAAVAAGHQVRVKQQQMFLLNLNESTNFNKMEKIRANCVLRFFFHN